MPNDPMPLDTRRPTVRLRSLIAVLLAFFLLAGLGTWQVKRLFWKEALIARIAERVKAVPSPSPPPASWAGLEAEAIEYRPVFFTARLDTEKEIHVFTALSQPKGVYGGAGYFVLSPAFLDDGTMIFVNRGFVPERFKEKETRPSPAEATPRRIEGLMRPLETGSLFTPEDDLEKNIWFVRDPKAMAAALGLAPERTAPFTVDLLAEGAKGALPQPGETLIVFPNNHLGYALTWYGLALALAVVSLRWLFLSRARRAL